jgi:hypothetical protein
MRLDLGRSRPFRPQPDILGSVRSDAQRSPHATSAFAIALLRGVAGREIADHRRDQAGALGPCSSATPRAIECKPWSSPTRPRSSSPAKRCSRLPPRIPSHRKHAGAEAAAGFAGLSSKPTRGLQPRTPSLPCSAADLFPGSANPACQAGLAGSRHAERPLPIPLDSRRSRPSRPKRTSWGQPASEQCADCRVRRSLHAGGALSGARDESAALMGMRHSQRSRLRLLIFFPSGRLGGGHRDARWHAGANATLYERGTPRRCRADVVADLSEVATPVRRSASATAGPGRRALSSRSAPGRVRGRVCRSSRASASRDRSRRAGPWRF